MIGLEYTSARLLFRVDPIPLESPRGYMCRVASAYHYQRPKWLMRLAGFSELEAALYSQDRAGRIAHLLRLEPEEWLAMCYRLVTRRGRRKRLFCGKPVSTYYLNLGKPRVCPACLREQSVWWAVWDLCLVAACPVHCCLLLDRCPGCKKNLACQRPAVHECRCGLDLRTLVTERAGADLLAINAVIYRAAGYLIGDAAQREINRHDFPPELFGLTLGSLLTLLGCAGSFGRRDIRGRGRAGCTRIDLNVAIQVGQTAVSILRNWPHQLRASLKGMVPENFEDAAALRFGKIFGTFYFRLFRGLPRKDFGFLHNGFEEFVREDWKGLVRGQHRYLSVSTREKSPWIPLAEATRIARTTRKRIENLVRQGQIEAGFFKLRRGRTQCWVRRDSLNQWITARDTCFGQYMSGPEVERTIGLGWAILRLVAQAGLIRYAQSADCGPRHGRQPFFLREDVMTIKLAFEKHAVPEREYSKPGEFIALGNAVRSFLGRHSGLAAAIRAVIDGTLVPVAFTSRIPGIMGYLFRSDHLRLYRPVRGALPSEGFLNYAEAASSLGSYRQVVRRLVENRILRGLPGCQRHNCKLVLAGEVQRFSNQYIGLNALARQLDVTGFWLRRHLEKTETPVLAVPVRAGVTSYFLRKDLAAALQIYPARMSRK